MPAPRKSAGPKMQSIQTDIIVPLLVHAVVSALKPLIHLGVAAIEPVVTAAFDQARPYILDATTAEDRAALGRIFAHLVAEPTTPTA